MRNFQSQQLQRLKTRNQSVQRIECIQIICVIGGILNDFDSLFDLLLKEIRWTVRALSNFVFISLVV